MRAPQRARVAASVPYALAVVFATAYTALSLGRHHRYDTPSWDNAIFEQAVRAYAHLHAPVVDIKGPGFNILGDHFSPIIALLAPVYRIFPHAQTLLVAQAVLVALPVAVIGRAACSRLGLAGGTAVAVAYGLSFGVAAAVYADFHEVAFAAPVIALAGVAYIDGRWRAVAAWSLALLLVKEDLGLTVLVIGLVIAWRGARRTGLVVAAAGLVGFLLVVLVVIPAFNPTGGYDYISVIGGGGADGPGPVTTFFTGWDTKALTLLVTFGITGFLGLRSPWVLVAGPTFAWRFVGDNAYYWGTDWHYGLILMPIVFVALLDALEQVRGSRRAWLRTYASHVPTLAVAVAIVLAVQFPLTDVIRPASFQASPRAASARAVMAMIPRGASVETDIGLITHLTADHRVFFAGTAERVVPDYVLIDVTAGWSTPPEVVSFAQQAHPGSTYQRVFARDGYLLARRLR